MAIQEVTDLLPTCENCLYYEKCRGEWYEEFCGYCEYWDPK